jgi:PadR family transcriptional regulator, regulatory protein PadR
MDAASEQKHRDAADVSPEGLTAAAPRDAAGRLSGAPGLGPSPLAIASNSDEAGAPVHRGWAPVGTHHRWMEPFVLAMLATGSAHGYAILGELRQLAITNGSVDVGQVYRTLRDLEEGGQVRSTWSTGTGPARRDYELTEFGFNALDEWGAVMKERARLVAEFDARYLEWLSARRRS